MSIRGSFGWWVSLLPTPSPLHAQLSHLVRKEHPLTQHLPSASPIPSHVILTEALGGRILVIPIFHKRKERGEISEQRSWHLWGLIRLPLQPQLLPEGHSPPSPWEPLWVGGAVDWELQGMNVNRCCYSIPFSSPSAAWPIWGKGRRGAALNPNPGKSVPLSPSPLPALHETWEARSLSLGSGGLAGQSRAQLSCISLVTTVGCLCPSPTSFPPLHPP